MLGFGFSATDARIFCLRQNIRASVAEIISQIILFVLEINGIKLRSFRISCPKSAW